MNYLKDFNGLTGQRQMEGKTLCLETHKWLESLSMEDFDRFAKTVMGGAILFIANQYANEYSKSVFYVGMYDRKAKTVKP